MLEQLRAERTNRRIALVTGGTRGIGGATAEALAAAGYQVAATYGSDEATAWRFSERTRIPVYRWDVGDYEACRAGIAQVQGELGPVDVLVNNAGITRDVTLQRSTLQQWSEVLQTNLFSCFHMCRAVIETMRQRAFGRIVNIASVNAQTGQFGQANYAAAKAGMQGFTRALAQEGAARNITVNTVAPGYIDTDMVRRVPDAALEKIVERIPVGRLGHAEEVARCVVFLAADEAGFITGSTLSVNGGQFMG